jgi:hypothetical protein
MFAKARKIFLYFAAYTAVVSMFIFTLLENYYINNPRTPDPVNGLVIPHEAKQAVIIYLTQTQSTIIHITAWILLVSGGLTIAHVILIQWWPIEDRK